MQICGKYSKKFSGGSRGRSRDLMQPLELSDISWGRYLWALFLGAFDAFYIDPVAKQAQGPAFRHDAAFQNAG